jgi:CheY-like chemotaxis protein
VRLVDDLLDVGRISRGKIELKTQRVELAPVVRHAVEMARRTAECAGHLITAGLPDEAIHLDADPARLAQVFGNLLNNACRYTAPGGHITVTAERQGSDAVVTVKDNGIGIAPDKLDEIFGLFFQVGRSLESTSGGLGIGLHLVKRLVGMHCGSVTAHSEGHSRGSAFVVRLPVSVVAGAAAPAVPMTAETAEVVRRRVLVVDDNLDSARTLSKLLARAGHDTLAVHDGLQAVEQAAAYDPDVILLDIGLPGMNGYDACLAIRRLERGGEILIIALTGWGQEEDRRKSSDAGFDAHLVKPVDFTQLMELLRRREPSPM